LGASHFRENTGEEFQTPYAAVKQNGISAKVGWGASHFRKNTGEEFQNPYSAVKQNGISAKVGCSQWDAPLSVLFL